MLVQRPRRLRKSPLVRELVREVDLSLSHLIQPYFLTEGATSQLPISGFTNVFRWGEESLTRKIEADVERGVKSFLLFGNAPDEKKDALGSEAYSDLGTIPKVVRGLRKRFGDSILLFTDVCLCPFTSHGHCGLIQGNQVVNDPTLNRLATMALVHAEAGADFVAPSDMMDGRVGAIREALDEKNLPDVGILAYTAKYASSYYGPFREALGSAPQGTDRASYQMDFRNSTEAIRELELDIAEGADMVMVKPALAYLDILRIFKDHSPVPIVAYSVSGEYEMVKLLAKNGMADERKLAIENLTAIRRAGADVVITYYASEMAEKGWLR